MASLRINGLPKPIQEILSSRLIEFLSKSRNIKIENGMLKIKRMFIDGYEVQWHGVPYGADTAIIPTSGVMMVDPESIYGRGVTDILFDEYHAPAIIIKNLRVFAMMEKNGDIGFVFLDRNTKYELEKTIEDIFDEYKMN